MQRSLMVDSYDAKINKTINRVIKQYWQKSKFDLWQQLEKARREFLNHLPKLKQELHAVLDEYLAKRNPNNNSKQILAWLFACIQSINDVDSARIAYHTIREIFPYRGEGYWSWVDTHGSPRLYKYSRKMLKKLDYYLNPTRGVFIQDRVIEEVYPFKERLLEWVDQLFTAKIAAILDVDTDLKQKLLAYDKVHHLLQEFRLKREEHYRYSFVNDPEAMEYECRQELMSTTNGDESKRRIAELKEEYKQYCIEQYHVKAKEMDAVGAKIIEMTHTLLKTTVKVKGDAESAFLLLKQEFKNNTPAQYRKIFDTVPEQLLDRLIILLGDAYPAFAKEFCATVISQFGSVNVGSIPKSELKSSVNQEDKVVYAESLKERKVKYRGFQFFQDQPSISVPEVSVQTGGALEFLYGDASI